MKAFKFATLCTLGVVLGVSFFAYFMFHAVEFLTTLSMKQGLELLAAMVVLFLFGVFFVFHKIFLEDGAKVEG